MKKLFIIILILFSLNSLIAQEQSGFAFSVPTVPAKFTFDGRAEFNPGVAIGIEYQGVKIPFAKYSTLILPNLEFDNDSTSAEISFLVGVRFWDQASFGLGYTFWRHKQPAFQVSRREFFFSLGYEMRSRKN